MNIVNVGSVASSVTGSGSPPTPAPQVNTTASTATQAAPVQTVNAVQQSALAPSSDQVKQAVQAINKSWANDRGLEFSIDHDSNVTVVKVIDMQTKDVIRQMPSEETLAIAKSLDQAIGSLVNGKA